MTDSQLLLVNNLIYQDTIRQDSFKNRSIKQMIESNNFIWDYDTGDMKEDEWNDIKNAITNDPEILNLKITDIYFDDTTGETNMCLVDTSNNQAYAVFRGTGKGGLREQYHCFRSCKR